MKTCRPSIPRISTTAKIAFGLVIGFVALITLPFAHSRAQVTGKRANASAAANACTPAPSGIVAWYPGEGNANDIQGNNNGTLHNVTFAPGEVGQAFSFNGLGADGSGSYVLVGNNDNLTPADQITLEAWFTDSDGANDLDMLISKFNYIGGKSPDSYAIFLNNGSIAFDIQTSPDGTLYSAGDLEFFQYVSPPATVNIYDGQFHHVAGTYDGATMSLYLDGALIGTQPAKGKIVATPQTPLQLGAGLEDGSPGYYHYGLLDEATIYNRALSAAEIQAIYNAGSAGKCNSSATPTPTATPTATPTGTPTPTPSTTPTPMPQGVTNGLIAFQSKRDGNYEIYTMNPDGTNPRNLTNNPANDVTPAWSPDGTQLAFASDRDTGGNNVDLYLMQVNPDGSPGTVTRLTTSTDGADSLYPTWSPDGKRIAYMHGQIDISSLQTLKASTSQLYVADVTTNAITPLTTDNTTKFVTPAWSPDGTQLAYASTDPGSGKFVLDISPIDANNTLYPPIHQFVDTNSNIVMPAWSPDGKSLAYASDLDGPLFDIWVAPVGPGTPNVLTFGSFAINGKPVFSPDGTKIAWMRGAQNSTSFSSLDIWTMNTDGSNQTALAGNSTAEDSFPSWQVIGAAATPTPTPTPTPTATPTPTPSQGDFTLTYEGRLRDKVSKSKPGLGADGEADGTFSIILPGTAVNRTVTKLDLVGENGNEWDTDPTNRNVWIVGAAPSIDGSLLNNDDGSVSFDTGNGDGTTKNFYIFIPDSNPSSFVQGQSFTLKITFSNGQTISASTTIGSVPTNSADLRIQVDAASNPVQVDGIETYTVYAQNLGPSTATNVQATITLPPAVSFVDYGNPPSSGCVQTAQGSRQFVCTYPSLAINAVATSVFRVKAVSSTSNDSTLGILNASVTSDLPDSITANNSVTNTISVVANPNPPGNDNLQSAVTSFTNYLTGKGATDYVLLGASGSVTGTNLGATKENPLKITNPLNGKLLTVSNYEPNHGGNEGGKSVWYVWVPPADASTGTTTAGVITFDTHGSSFDTLLAVYDLSLSDDTFGEYNVIAQNDDYYADGTSQVSFPYTADHVYFIAVDGYKGASGNIKLNWTATESKPLAACTQNIPDMSQGIFPSAGSRLDVDPQSGYFIMHVKGTGFTSQSQVIIDGDISVGTTLDGRVATLVTNFVSSNELIANIPPLPIFNISKHHVVQVITPLPGGCSGGTKMRTESIPAGTYSVAADSREFDSIDYQTVTLQPGETKTVCYTGASTNGKQVCDDVTNFFSSPLTVTPSVFDASRDAHYKSEAQNVGDALYQTEFHLDLSNLGLLPSPLVSSGMALNSPTPLPPSGSSGGVGVSLQTNIPPGVASQGTGPLLLVQGAGNGLIGQDGSGIVAGGGGNVVSTNGSNIISDNSEGIVAGGGGNLITHDGGSLITHDGGSSVGNARDTFTQQGKHTESLSAKGGGIRTLSAADVQVSSGWFVVQSSGGKMPTYTSTTDPVDGTTSGKLSVKFDDTSNPKVSNLQGLAFVAAVNPPILQLANTNISVNRDAGFATVTITRTGPTDNYAFIDYATVNGTASDRSDYEPQFSALQFAPGDTQQSFQIPIINNGLGAQGDQKTFQVILRNPFGAAFMMPNIATVTITNNTGSSTANPVDDPTFFVTQHYFDFLNRQPDQAGLNFWVDQITSCNGDPACIDNKRQNVSAAYFLSTEFQQTGYLVYKAYKAAYGDINPPAVPVPVRFADFVPDVQVIGHGVVVGADGWQDKLEANKQQFFNAFVTRPQFTAKYGSLSNSDYVNALNQNVGGVLAASDISTLLAGLNAGTETRATVLRKVAENSAVDQTEFSKAFVLMQYFGYLRRDPDAAPDSDFSGYNFWLKKLNAANGNYIASQMVRSFIVSQEYRKRFGGQ